MSDQPPQVVIVRRGGGGIGCLLLAILLTLLFGGWWIVAPLIIGAGAVAVSVAPQATPAPAAPPAATPRPVIAARPVATPTPRPVATATPLPRRIGPVSVGAWAEVVRERSWTTPAGITRLRKGRMVFVREITPPHASVELGDTVVQVDLADLR